MAKHRVVFYSLGLMIFLVSLGILTMVTSSLFAPGAINITSQYENDISVETKFSLVTSNPRMFHDREVRVSGIINLEFEGNALYPNLEDYKTRNTKSAIFLGGLWPVPKEYSGLEGKLVTVVGRVDSSSNGHMGLFSALIREVVSIEEVR